MSPAGGQTTTCTYNHHSTYPLIQYRTPGSRRHRRQTTPQLGGFSPRDHHRSDPPRVPPLLSIAGNGPANSRKSALRSRVLTDPVITFLDHEGRRHRHIRDTDRYPDYQDLTHVAVSTDAECYGCHRNRGPVSRLERRFSSADPSLWAELCDAWSRMEAEVLHCQAWSLPIESVRPIVVKRQDKIYTFRTDMMARDYPACYEVNCLSETIDRVCIISPNTHSDELETQIVPCPPTANAIRRH